MSTISKAWKITLIVIILVLIVFGGTLVTLYTDWLWFKDLGYSIVFSRAILTRVIMTLAFGVIFFAIVYGNIIIARRIAPPITPRYGGTDIDLRERFGSIARSWLNLLLLAISLAAAVPAGLNAGGHWEEWLRYYNAQPFGIADPVFGIDVGFYIFKLPLLKFLYGWFFFTLIATAIAVVITHYAYESIDVIAGWPRFAPKVKNHIALIVALMFLLRAFGYKLAFYELLLPKYGIVQSQDVLFAGADYTDIHARLYALWILIAACVVGGILVAINSHTKGLALSIGALAGVIAVSIFAGAIYPAAVSQFVVKPNALEKQTPYIKNAIKFTQIAYQLDTNSVESREFYYEPTLTQEQISKNKAAIQNVRLWDYQPLLRTYQQIQELQQFYAFNDVDIDRYIIDGALRQVMLSARELTGAPEKARSWVNLHLRYTHGYGFVMSPVNEVTSEGLPVFFASQIPVTTKAEIKIDTPQIYFGELTNNYVFVNTKESEFDYRGGDRDVETKHSAKSGPMLGGFWRKMAFALRFGDINILLSSAMTPESRILYKRNIVERSQALFPYLKFDNDPYLVVAYGKLYWFHDAYTTASEFPYSEPIEGSNINYIRNSVKIVTDAYTGKVQAYISDTNDPIIKVYQRIFPGTLKPFSEMPEEFKSHLRYPEDMFNLQAYIYCKYHMTDPDTFFSKTDLWQLPQSAGGEEQNSTLEPYYIITRLPNANKDEFLLILPLIRAAKNNMVAWIAARWDPTSRSRMTVYQFPSGSLVFGPSQVMSRANQNPDISRELTLWGQMGSSVVRGNLLAIPIENSILYIEPLYLESTRTKIPEFKRVIAALGESVTMKPTFEEALTELTGVRKLPTTPKVTPKTPTGKPQPTPGIRELIKRAAEQLSRAEEAQRRGDWAGYGREITGLRQTISELRKLGGNP
jgi:uncharacterized membrane protein (UPF0182 family)